MGRLLEEEGRVVGSYVAACIVGELGKGQMGLSLVRGEDNFFKVVAYNIHVRLRKFIFRDRMSAIVAALEMACHDVAASYPTTPTTPKSPGSMAVSPLACPPYGASCLDSHLWEAEMPISFASPNPTASFDLMTGVARRVNNRNVVEPSSSKRIQVAGNVELGANQVGHLLFLRACHEAYNLQTQQYEENSGQWSPWLPLQPLRGLCWRKQPSVGKRPPSWFECALEHDPPISAKNMTKDQNTLGQEREREKRNDEWARWLPQLALVAMKKLSGYRVKEETIQSGHVKVRGRAKVDPNHWTTLCRRAAWLEATLRQQQRQITELERLLITNYESKVEREAIKTVDVNVKILENFVFI
ncbi:hypothetical protein CYMTET_21345 [Cymbomonas tetramitiformis]|uniref:Uncharacterized protein n=1 Tax=Cymbomonas tetramitiformis TaxID=36881 RepID=A0AAE0G2B5_9CHLO|nr:hypothetical protein CYMTET_21345 [Cymbomonas tetramitiformis]